MNKLKNKQKKISRSPYIIKHHFMNIKNVCIRMLFPVRTRKVFGILKLSASGIIELLKLQEGNTDC